MTEKREFEGEDVEAALAAASEGFGIDADLLEYEVIQEPEHKLLGKDAPAKIEAWLSEEDDFEDESSANVAEEEHSGGIVEDERQPFSPEREALSDEELDQIADTAIATLRSMLAYFDAEDATIDEYEGDEGEILLDVVGDDLAILIGRHGRTLDALQFLLTSIVNRKLGRRYPVVIDIEGYKYRRKQKVEGIAKSAAARALKQDSAVKLHPMSPYERRLVHIALRDDTRVTTDSEGEDPDRYVVIKPRKF